jgi:hypothetical protein
MRYRTVIFAVIAALAIVAVGVRDRFFPGRVFPATAVPTLRDHCFPCNNPDSSDCRDDPSDPKKRFAQSIGWVLGGPKQTFVCCPDGHESRLVLDEKGKAKSVICVENGSRTP